MRNLKKAGVLPKVLLANVIQSKKGENRTRLNEMKEELESRFDEYEDKAKSGTLHLLKEKWHYDKNTVGSDGVFLYSQYDNSKATIEEQVKTSVIAANEDEIILKCPICELRDDIEWDHYVPRSLFPEFSFHSYNLIPICHTCNNKKKKQWCEKGKRLFFNAYYDTPTDECIFEVSVNEENKILKFNISLMNFEKPQEQTRLALSTIESLELMSYVNKKLNEKFNKQLTELIRRRKHFPGSDEEYLLMEMGTLDDGIAEIEDVNNWDRIIMTAIKDSPIVERWLRKQFNN